METAVSNEEKVRPDVYGLITQKIIEQLDKGTVPWRKPWSEAGLPQNIISGKHYSGINMMLLAMAGYENNHFITFKQLKEIGGKVKKGEKAHMVVFWSLLEGSQTETSETASEKEPQKKAILRYYYVFNVAQCDNIPEKYRPAIREVRNIPAYDSIIKGMPQCPLIKHKEQRAYYNVKEDFVNMPKRKSFADDESYYSTLFHELVHSTGHENRLNRQTLTEMAEFGGETYSQEELIAEIGTCYLMSHAGSDSQFQQSTAYIQGWLNKLRNDKRFIFTAAKASQKAVDFILNIQKTQGESEEKGE